MRYDTRSGTRLQRLSASLLAAVALAASALAASTPTGCGSNDASSADGGSSGTDGAGTVGTDGSDTEDSGGRDAGGSETGSGDGGGNDSDSDAASAAEMPGISAALFASPYYECAKNFYVATDGSDQNDGTTATTGGGHGPWLTIQHANDSVVPGGECVNIASGVYPVTTGITLTQGGRRGHAGGLRRLPFRRFSGVRSFARRPRSRGRSS